MRIISWNVAGIRGILKRGNLQDLIEKENPDIICLQETKAEESQVELPKWLQTQYPYRFWESTKGTTQRKGLSGTSIWSKTKPVRQYNPPEIDEEGRITTIEFKDFIIMTVYTPNSQCLDSPRLQFRTTEWHNGFKEYIKALIQLKPTIICGDFNVAHHNIDIHNPEQHHKYAGFLDIERKQFQEYLDIGYTDQFRKFNPKTEKRYTYWNQINPKIRANNSGWRIDYFLCSEDCNAFVKNCDNWDKIYGSDHCPIYLELL
jgi:exodeoxyribonuclease III